MAKQICLTNKIAWLEISEAHVSLIVKWLFKFMFHCWGYIQRRNMIIWFIIPKLYGFLKSWKWMPSKWNYTLLVHNCNICAMRHTLCCTGICLELLVTWTIDFYNYTVFFVRKPFFCLSLNFLNITLEIRLRFS